jgi:hypothetical protein
MHEGGWVKIIGRSHEDLRELQVKVEDIMQYIIALAIRYILIWKGKEMMTCHIPCEEKLLYGKRKVSC